jgi:hypothetical protein
MAKPDIDATRRLEELTEQHRAALGSGDLEALERIQVELDELLNEQPAIGPLGNSAAAAPLPK